VSASNYSVSQMAPQTDKLMDNSKSLIVGWSRCKLARWMEQWESTTDDNGQWETGTNITPTSDKSTIIGWWAR
jgi:hypothetical protein